MKEKYPKFEVILNGNLKFAEFPDKVMALELAIHLYKFQNNIPTKVVSGNEVILCL